jgi:hypothetical protein
MPPFIGLIRALVVSTGLAALLSQAHAIPLNEASSFASVTLNGSQQTAEFGTSFASVSPTLGNASGTLTANSQPAPNITANVSLNGPGQSIAQGFLVYWFAAVGPSNVSVPVTITASSWVSVPQFIDQHASSLYLGGSQLLGHTCLSPAAPQNCLSQGGEQQSFSIDTPVVLQSNTQYSLQLNLYVGLTNFGSPPPGTSASGYIDPILTIDPTFALADQFHLEFSAGVGTARPLCRSPQHCRCS